MEIKIYTRPTCKWCDQAKEWFATKEIAFEECDITGTQNRTVRDEILEKSGQMAVPVFDIAGKIITGFKLDVLEELLDNLLE